MAIAAVEKTIHTLPALPYPFDALEPYIDTQTMQIHHGKHHAAYVANLNKAIEGHPELADRSVEALLADIEHVPAEIRQAVINNGGGHANHSLFWPGMAPAGRGGGGEPTGELAAAITGTFGSFAKFKDVFTQAATTRFGSGWAWLLADANGELRKLRKLRVESTPNQDSPITHGHVPIVILDVWEHAYYLKYQNRRADYITAWWNVVNWSAAAERFGQTR